MSSFLPVDSGIANAFVVSLAAKTEKIVRLYAPVGQPAENYPVISFEEWELGAGDRATIWLELRPAEVPGFAWFAPLNPVVTNNPAASLASYAPARSYDTQLCVLRPDGQVVMTDEQATTASPYNQWYPMQWINEDDGALRQDGGPNIDYLGYPEFQIALQARFTTYLRIDLGPASIVTDPSFHSMQWADLWFWLYPRPALSTPMIWHWQPGDDHYGLQGNGYQHSTLPLATKPSSLVTGVALLLQDSIENYFYGTRDMIVGYTDDLGPFFYGYLEPEAMQRDQFSDSAVFTYGGNDLSSDNKGNIVSSLTWQADWAGELTRWQSAGFGDWQYEVTGLFDSYFQPASESSPSYDPAVVWRSHVEGLYLFSGPAGVDSLYAEEFFFPDDPVYAWRANLDIHVTLGVGATDGGFYARGNTAATQRMKVSNSQLIWRNAGAETVLDSWPAVADGTVMRWVAVGDNIKIYANGALISNVTSSLGQLNEYWGLWSQPGSAVRIRSARGMNAVAIDTLFISTVRYTPALHELTKPVKLSTELGYLIKGEVPWPSEAYRDGRYPDFPTLEVHWTVSSPAYPNSVFVLISNANLDTATYRQFELDKLTGAVIREMAPFVFSDPRYDSFSGTYVPRIDVSDMPLVSADGMTITGVFRTTFALYEVVDELEKSYNLATEVIGDVGAVPYDSAARIGRLDATHDVYANITLSNSVKIHDRDVNAWVPVTLEAYAGKGFNGHLLGFDGRHLWGGQLNYHIDPQHYQLSAEQTAGTSYSAGDEVSVGFGHSDFFCEIYRYDLSAALVGVSFTNAYRVTNNDHLNVLILEVSLDSGVTYSSEVTLTDASSVNIGTTSPDDVRFRLTDNSYGGPTWLAYKTLTPSVGSHTITFDAPVTLMPGTDYWMVMQNCATNAQRSGPATLTGISATHGMYYSFATGTFGSFDSAAYPIFVLEAASGPNASIAHTPIDDFWGPSSIAQMFQVTAPITVTGLTAYWGGAAATGRFGLASARGISFTLANDAHVRRTAISGAGYTGWRWNFDDAGTNPQPSDVTDGDFDDIIVEVTSTLDGASPTVPIEYVFNLDHEYPQNYCRYIEPNLDTSDGGNRLTHNQWSPQNLTGFTVDAGAVTAGAGMLQVSTATNAAVRLLPQQAVSAFTYGLGQYFFLTAKIRRVSGTASGTVTIQLIGYNGSGVQTGSAIDTLAVNVSSLGTTFANYKGDPYGYAQGAAPASVTLGVVITTTGFAADTVVAIEHLNLIPNPTNYGTQYFDFEPGIAVQQRIIGWMNAGDFGVEYYFPEWAIPGSFAPMPLTAAVGPQRARFTPYGPTP